MPRPSRPDPEQPPRVPWAAWYRDRAARMRQGMHVLYCGPTQSGKTTLARFDAALRDFVVVFGTKAVDPSLDDYLREGYLRVDHWPLTDKDMKRGRELWDDSEVRVILWPRIRERADLRRYRGLYQACMEQVFIEGRWTLVIDESLWFGSPKGLALGQELGDLSYGSASNKVSLLMLMQRPSGVPRITWSSVASAEIFHGGVTADVRELASLGTYPPRDVQRVIQGLRGHEFLDLPTRGQAEWSVSAVEL